MPFKFLKMRIPEIIVIEPKVHSDTRGFFVELIQKSDFQANGVLIDLVQVSQSRSQKGVVRGLHYQMNPKAQAKIVSVSQGEIFDVAVDIRRGSPSYGHWAATHLSGENKKMIYIPEGFAHGFCVLSENADILYFCSKEYDPDTERTIAWDDPAIGITWPIKEPVRSPKDSQARPLSLADNNFDYIKNHG